MIYDDQRILLGMKKQGFGAGKWNGFGGKVESNETIEQAAIRELNEEIGLTATALTPRGVLNFYGEDSQYPHIEMHIFAVEQYSGEPIESAEMKPQWFLHADIPYDAMWPDDPHWLPHFLAGKDVSGDVYFDANGTLLHHTIEAL